MYSNFINYIKLMHIGYITIYLILDISKNKDLNWIIIHLHLVTFSIDE